MSDEKRDCRHSWSWTPNTNERGWSCHLCGHRPGEEPGYDPHLDAECIEIKVECLLSVLHNADLAYVSNGSDGHETVASVAGRCKQTGIYNQAAIIAWILAPMAESPFWAERGRSIREGRDNRRRCHCGKLAKAYVGGKDFCLDHWRTK